MEKYDQKGDLALWVYSLIRNFVQHSPDNSLQNPKREKAWADPLVGFSRGDDPIYQIFKDRIGPFYWTPGEIFSQSFPGVVLGPDELTVISWVLPQTEATKSDNRQQSTYPSERWARSRVFGERFNDQLRREVATSLEKAGHPAVAPCLSELWGRKDSERYGYASNWSERHAAYASGLGTFGLSEGLITPRGKAMRCGSVVAAIRIPPSSRPYEDHHAYCLYFSQGRCGECIPRCPVGAITESGHDKVACERYHLQAIAGYVKFHFGFEGYACGLCQAKVPCESRIPS